MFSSKLLIASAVLAVSLAPLSQAAVISIPASEGVTIIPNSNGVNLDFFYSGYYYSYETTETFLRFDLSALAASPGQQLVINSAAIAVNSGSFFGSAFTEDLYTVSNDTWTRPAATWANRPASGSTIISSQTTFPSWGYGTFFNSTTDLVNYVSQEAQGDGDASVMFKASGLGAVPANPGGSDQHAEYYGNALTTLEINYDFVPVPEPASAGLLGAGLMLALGSRRRRG